MIGQGRRGRAEAQCEKRMNERADCLGGGLGMECNKLGS